ncbi:hypothetical protein YPPY94_4253, partial [Yersinia pestis PY-94]
DYPLDLISGVGCGSLLHRSLQLREALVALKGPLGNIPAFRSRLQDLLGNEDMREQLLKELDILNQK